jgi:hypothetical protein
MNLLAGFRFCCFTPLAQTKRSRIASRSILQLVDWTGRQVREDKRGAIDARLPPIMIRLHIDPDAWRCDRVATSLDARSVVWTIFACVPTRSDSRGFAGCARQSKCTHSACGPDDLRQQIANTLFFAADADTTALSHHRRRTKRLVTPGGIERVRPRPDP